MTGGVSFALGALGFAIATVRSAVMNLLPSWLVVGALVVMAAARFAPLSAAPYVITVAGILALWPLAFAMWKRAEGRPAEQPRPMPAT